MESIHISLEDVSFVGHDLRRPECVLATAGGDLYVSDWRGGITWLRPDGEQQSILATADDKRPVQPNGIALTDDGAFLLADLGDERGGVWRLSPDGDLEPFLVELDGDAVPPANFVCIDARGRTWITISTRVAPRSNDYRPKADSGYIILVDERGARIVADGLGYTNECRVDPSGRSLYVNETFGRRLTRYRIQSEGSLIDRETVATFGPGTFPDGLAFDAEGGVWIASIVSNRVIRVAPDGSQRTVLEDADPDYVDRVERAFQAGTMARPHLDQIQSQTLRSISSIAFGGPDLRTVYLGCLLGSRIATFRSPIAGHPPAHWHHETPTLPA